MRAPRSFELGVQLRPPTDCCGSELVLLLAEHGQQLLVLWLSSAAPAAPSRATRFLVLELALEQLDVPLALAQHVGRARHVDERRAADLRAMRADGDEEVRLRRRQRRPASSATSRRVAGLTGWNDDALHVILQKQRDVREDSLRARRGTRRTRIRGRETDSARPAGAIPRSRACSAWRR